MLLGSQPVKQAGFAPMPYLLDSTFSNIYFNFQDLQLQGHDFSFDCLSQFVTLKIELFNIIILLYAPELILSESKTTPSR